LRLIPVLFEDHSLTNFRPVALSQPVYEMRVGVFNVRERVEALREFKDQNGILLSRQVLRGLHPESNWQILNAPSPRREDEDLRYLWINGRLRADFSSLSSLVRDILAGQEVHIQDGEGSLAFSCNAHEHLENLEHWFSWETENGASQAFYRNELKPTRWAPILTKEFSKVEGMEGLGWIWDIVPATSRLITADLDQVIKKQSFWRKPFGVFLEDNESAPPWARKTRLFEWEPTSEVHFQGDHPVYCTGKVDLAPGTALDTREGPILLDRDVKVFPHSYLQGPLYLGAGSTVKAGATLYGQSSFGIVNKLSGEIGESTFGDFSNKQHDGFIGHAVLGSWINLGAMTTCSDLKNNYGNVRVDLGCGQIDTQLRFVGLLMGDHAKTAIGTLFNTGTAVGFASNIFGGVMPPKFIESFSWGGHPDSPAYAVDKALSTGKVVMARRGCQLTEDHEKLFRSLAQQG